MRTPKFRSTSDDRPPSPRRASRSLLLSLLITVTVAAGALVATGAGAAEPYEIGGRVRLDNGAGVTAVKADLFAANPDGSRANFLATTDSETTGDYRFGVDNGCYVIVLQAPADLSFDPNEPDEWHQQGACVANGSVTDIDATLYGPDVLTVDGQVAFQDGSAAPGVKANLYTARSAHNRDEWQGSRTTDANGSYSFEVDADCYVVVLGALDGTSFSPDGPDEWHQEYGCAIDAPLDVSATLYAIDGTLEIGGTVSFASGAAAADIRTNLYTAHPDRSRDQWLGSANTSPDGTYSFEVDAGCYVMVLQAPIGRSFEDVGPDRWHQEHRCVQGGPVTDIDATLYETEQANSPRNPSCFTQVFRDDFSQESWGNVGPDTWRRYPAEHISIGAGNAGHGKRWHDAISVESGLLNIKATMRNGEVHSGGMAHNFDQAYGFYEFRVRVDADPSEATSGVVLTWPESDNQVPDGENDMFETIATGIDENGNSIPIGNASRRPVKSFMHYTDGGIDRHTERQFAESDGTRWAIHAMEWVPGEIIFYRNGQPTDVITSNVPTARHHMTIQLDAWLDQMGEPVDLQVDWVTIDAYTC